MSSKSYENLKPIRFEGELLPNWAQLLDLAASLSRAPEDVRRWFSRFGSSSGVDDSRTIAEHCDILRARIREHWEAISTQLQSNRDDAQPSQILGAWMYALDTMIQEARSRKACSWIIEGVEGTAADDSGGGDVTLRRV